METLSLCIQMGSHRINYAYMHFSTYFFKNNTDSGRGHFKFPQDDPMGNRCLGDGMRRLDRPLHYLVLCLAQHAQRYEGIPSWSLFQLVLFILICLPFYIISN